MRSALLIGIGSAILASCATPEACRGLQPGAPGSSLAGLQCASARGDREAITALARRYELGSGVPADPQRAARLYAQAATAEPATTAIYSPPVRIGGRGQMLFLPNPDAGPGVAEAQYRLGLMYVDGRGVKKDAERGLGLLKAAVQQGHVGAQEAIARLSR